MAHDTFRIGDLEAVIGNNDPHDFGGRKQRAGYNGLWSLKHRTGKRSLFVPGIAGLNLEHIVSGEGESDRDIFFEPRRAKMTFKRLSDSAAELHQPPTPTFFLESWTRFEVKPPHYIDMTFRCRPTQHVFSFDYIGLFWASYINAPNDKSMYFLGGLDEKSGNRWSQLCTPAHNHHSTVKHRDDQFDMSFAEGAPDALYKNFSPLRFDVPFFYGAFDEHIFIVMLDRSEGIRLTHSPSGGGGNRELKTTNPAWDFQWIISPYEVMTDYEMKVRVVFRERCSREEIRGEFEAWRS